MSTLASFFSDHKHLITKKKLKVRELDEESTGHFVSFVDEGKESFDVHVSLDDKYELIKFECDCENKKPCHHQVFLVKHISEKRQLAPEKLGRKSLKKIPEHHVLIDSLDDFKLRDWLKDLMDNNKAVRFEFLLQFKEISFSAEAIENSMLEAISSTTNNRKKLDQLQIKNLLQIFDKINQPIYDKIKESKDLRSSILLTIMVSKTMNSHYNMIKSNSKKYESYLDNVFHLLNGPFIESTSEIFSLCIETFIQNVQRERSIKTRAFDYLYYLQDIVDTKKRLLLMSHLKFLENSMLKTKPNYSASQLTH